MKSCAMMLPVVLSIGLFGCNSNNEIEVEDPITTDENPETAFFDRELPSDLPLLKVVTTGTMPPFSSRDINGDITGIDIDIIDALGEDQGFAIELHTETWQDLFESVSSGKYDLAIGGISYRDDRAEKYALSDTYYYNPSAIMYLDPTLNITSLNDIQGLRVSVMEGTKQYKQIKAVGGYSQLTTTATPLLLFGELVQGKVDVAAMDMPILQHISSSFPEQDVVIIPYESVDEPSAHQVIMMAKDNVELVEKINRGINNLKLSGDLKAIENKWKSQND